MNRQPTASFLYRRVIARAAHTLALCCIPIFTLVLVMNRSAAGPADQSHAPREHA
jgi:hypothetical protein